MYGILLSQNDFQTAEFFLLQSKGKKRKSYNVSRCQGKDLSIFGYIYLNLVVTRAHTR